jgi:hypothetical protein
MIERVHEHIVSELQQNTRTDTIFILTAILLNLLMLGINSGVASAGQDVTQTVVMLLFVALLVVVNVVVIVGLQKGKQNRLTLTRGLLKMYQDQGVAGYYDESLLGSYNMRYNLFILAVVVTGVVALVVPFIIR